MCRIAGFIDPAVQDPGRTIMRMRDSMKHGGPDGCGIFLDPEANLALGHRRLSIIDLSDHAHQPMAADDGQLVLVFNGEIYNYRELRSELKKLHHHFHSDSDTEVILRSYLEWGRQCFSRFKGMFALALYDRRRSELVLARDHGGIKPLYYYQDAGCIYFASEVRAFSEAGKCEEDSNWPVYFLTYGFLPGGLTTLKGVQSLEKGSIKIFDIHSLENSQEYFYKEEFEEHISDPGEAKKGIREAMDNSVRRHLIADAPLGLFLSGGVDSSVLTLIARQYKEELHTVSIVFDEEQYSEQYYQDLVAKKAGSVHQSFLLTKETFVAAVPDILRAMDQPSADGINSYFISKFAREAGLKAVISGLGADELFGGYPSFRRTGLVYGLSLLPSFMLQHSSRLPNVKHHKISFLSERNQLGRYLFNRGYFPTIQTARMMDMDEHQVRSLLFGGKRLEDIPGLSRGNQSCYLETNLYMEGQLLKDTDFMSMWHGVEVRVPFLDIDLMRMAHRLQSRLKYGNRQGKFLLIDSFRDLLPPEISTRRKKGFQLPFDHWMQDSLNQFIHTRQEEKIRKEFNNGHLGWGRYWTYILAKNYKTMNAGTVPQT